MNIYKKAQTATEYLIILAVVIIIALIVIGVLGGVPGIGGSSKGNVADAYWQTAKIGVDGFNIPAGTTSENSLILMNNLAVDISIINVTLGGSSISNASDLNITILAGRTATLSQSLHSAALGALGFDLAFGVCNSASAGDDFSTELVVYYQDSDTDAIYEFTGEENLEGECSV